MPNLHSGVPAPLSTLRQAGTHAFQVLSITLARGDALGRNSRPARPARGAVRGSRPSLPRRRPPRRRSPPTRRPPPAPIRAGRGRSSSTPARPSGTSRRSKAGPTRSRSSRGRPSRTGRRARRRRRSARSRSRPDRGVPGRAPRADGSPITEYNFKTLTPDQTKALVADCAEPAAELARHRSPTACSPMSVAARSRSKTRPASRPIRRRSSGRRRRRFSSTSTAIRSGAQSKASISATRSIPTGICSSTRLAKRSTCATTNRGSRPLTWPDRGRRCPRNCPRVSRSCPRTTTGRT